MADAAAAPIAAPNAPTSAPANVAAAKPAAPVAPAVAEALFEVMVDGQPQKFTKAQAEKMLSKAGYADKTIQQVREAMKAIKAREEELEKERNEKDPDAILRSRGHDPDEYARAKLEKRLAEAQMTPEQRRIAELEAAQAEKDAKLKEYTERESKAKLSESTARLQKKIEADLSTAAEKAGIPKDGDGFYAVYEVVEEFKKLGLPFDAEQIAETAKDNIENTFKNLEKAVLGGLEGQALEDRLGKVVADKLVSHRVAMIRGGGKKPTAPPAPAAAQKPDDGGYMTPAEARNAIRGLGK